MFNFSHSMFNMPSRADFVCANAFCAEMNNALILDNAIALSIFVVLLSLITLLILRFSRSRNQTDVYLNASNPVA